MTADTTFSEPRADVVVITRLLSAPRDLVFRVCSQPEHLARWFGPKDFRLPTCELDFRVGGAYRFCMRAPDGRDHWVSGFYREIIEPEMIVFTWNRRPGDVEDITESLVTLTLEPRNGKTLLTMRHEGLRSGKDRVDHTGGWSEALDRLAAVVETA